MGIFKKTPEEKAEVLQAVGEKQRKKEERLSEVQDKSEGKAREKATLSGFNVTEAIYVFKCLPNDDEKGTLNMPFGAIFNDRVAKFQKRWTGNVNEEIPVKNITSVEISKGILPTVTVYASGNTMTFKVGVEATKIASTVRELISKGTANQTIIDPVAQVEKLAQLLEKDLITRDEFDKKKREILGL
ncbi:unannotated protein [freshwater metagenome]|uniref:Unannotated protein n=1 Tax=freshwater metagenome TaxID=449393 RepID=A0A6J7U202_9ZZZZ|nr:hypothetical protein [Actinomycetota bacterium]MTA60233.1 hypothetical protein [Actinomycetota bacterium]MUH47067.1 hypothetical protein [Actinomycetota bacterium]